ncbi:hypothetical protein KIPB_010307, partial [Kipferlia bialata]|eukprot:g10307.t1
MEPSSEVSISTAREDELVLLRKVGIVTAAMSACMQAIPLLCTLAVFGIYIIQGHELTPTVAFQGISLFTILQFPIYAVPRVVASFIEAKNAAERIGSFLSLPERQSCTVNTYTGCCGDRDTGREREIEDTVACVPGVCQESQTPSISADTCTLSWYRESEAVSVSTSNKVLSKELMRRQKQKEREQARALAKLKERERKKRGREKRQGPSVRITSEAVSESEVAENVEGEGEGEGEDAHADVPFSLSIPQFRVEGSGIMAVIGPVGSGKSSFLAALSGDMSAVGQDG